MVIGSVCVDGKLYAYSQKHSPEQPFYRGAPTVCIDVFTGDELWSIGMNGGVFLRRGGIVVADGYMTLSEWNGVMYTFGPGLSETTVAASSVGQSVLVTGSVLDLSPAQPGAQCVSKESMAALMEQIHLQAPVGGFFSDVMLIGVPVLLTVTDSNGNSYEIDTVTSDGYSGTFSYEWTPERAGKYTITATFMGDESYDSSFATTYVVVPEAPAEVEAPPKDNSTIIAIAIVGIAIIIAIILGDLLILKKKH
jgi:hypothetical protein